MIVEYESKATAAHNLDPRAKMMWLATIVIISVVWTHPIYLFVLGFTVVAFGIAADFPWRKLRGLAMFLLIVTAIITLIQGATYIPRTVTIEDPSLVMFHLIPSWIPGIGPTWPVRLGGLLAGVSMALKVFLVLIAVAVFGYITPPSEIVQLIARIPGMPYQVGFVVSTAWKFVPVIQLQMKTLMEAHRSKGMDFEKGSFPERIRKTAVVVSPLFANALTMADTIALAMESRAFGSSKRFTFIRPYRLKPGDWAAMVICTAALIGSIAALVSLKLGAL